MRKKYSGTPPCPPINPILAGQMAKFQKYPRRAYHRLLKFCMGSQVTKILRFHEILFLETPSTPWINPILTGKWANFK